MAGAVGNVMDLGDAGITPMKRGLKAFHTFPPTLPASGDAGITPMKRGLKGNIHPGAICCGPRCRDYPDEKGTERMWRKPSPNTWKRCRDYPDEKGTERATYGLRVGRLQDAGITPMKRGLKGALAHI